MWDGSTISCILGVPKFRWNKGAMTMPYLFSCLILCLLCSTAQAEEPTVLFFGDSLTAGYGLDPAFAFPNLIQQRLAARGVAIRAVNAGVSGETSAGGLARVSWVLKRPVDVVVLALGANDGLRGVDPEVTKRNLRGIVVKVRELSPRAKVILAGIDIPPNLGPEHRARFKAIYSELADELALPFISFLLEGVGGVRELNLPDGIHPNEQGQRRVAENVYPVVAKALGVPE